MNFTDWTAKLVKDRIIEMADTLRMVPAVKGPKSYGNAMPEGVRQRSEAFGYHKATYRETASAAALWRMEQCFGWINSLPDQYDRELLYGWSFEKVRTGRSLADFAEENGMNERKLLRAVIAICQRIADRLNQERQIRLSAPDCAVSENAFELTSTTVSSEKCATHWRASDGRPHIDPALPKSRVIEPRKIRARHSEKNRSLGAR